MKTNDELRITNYESETNNSPLACPPESVAVDEGGRGVSQLVGPGCVRTPEESKTSLQGYVQFEFAGPELKDIYAITDLAVSRAGATTVVELALLGKPMILVPLGTSASRGEQSLNAAYMKDHAAATIVSEEELPEKGIATVQELLQDKEAQQTMSRNSKNIFLPNALEKITALLLEHTK